MEEIPFETPYVSFLGNVVQYLDCHIRRANSFGQRHTLSQYAASKYHVPIP